jgi:hypothetical protein
MSSEDPDKIVEHRIVEIANTEISSMLVYIKDDIRELKTEIKENRTSMEDRIGKLDTRIWGIMVVTACGAIGMLIKMLIDLNIAG